jgi:hypothetical protein
MSCPEIITTAKPDEYRAGAVVYRIANQGDNEILKSILRQTPMISWVTLCTQHEPCYFASANMFGHRETILAYKDDTSAKTVGMGSYVKTAVHINGNMVTAGYLGELRVLPAFRNKPGIIRNAFKSLKKLAGTLAEDAHWFTSIATQNTVAKRLLEVNLKGMPVYRPQGELVTMALSARAGKFSNIMQRAQVVDIPALAEFYNRQARQFQYSPVLSEQWLRNLDGGNGLRLQDFWLLKDGESIRACFAVWDQRKFKQTVVRGYRFPLNIVCRLHNLLPNLSRRVRLPRVGEQINYVFIAFLAIDKSVQIRCRAIIESALALIKSVNVDIAMLGLSSHNPIFKQLDAYPKKTYHSCIESVTWPDQPGPVQSNSKSESGIVQPEAALL